MKNAVKFTTGRITYFFLKLYHVNPTRYHGGDLEGNPIRRLMKNGNDVFREISLQFCKLNYDNELGNRNDAIDDIEIKIMCHDYSNFFCLFDNVFSVLNSERGTINSKKIEKCIECVKVVFDKWV